MHFALIMLSSLMNLSRGLILSSISCSSYPCTIRSSTGVHLNTFRLCSSNTSADDNIKEKSSENYVKSYSVVGIGRGSYTKSHTNTGHLLETDIPKKMGGNDSAPQPVEHLLAALIGCTQATAIFVGRSMRPRLNIERIEFDLHANRDERGALELPIDKRPDIPARLISVSGTVDIFLKDDKEISQSELILLAEQTELRCPVANMMLASGCLLDLRWKSGEDSIVLSKLKI